MKIAITYTLFAIIAILSNIISQDISLRLYAGEYSIFLSILVGTFIGLIVKYKLDKEFIFCYQTKNIIHNTQTFSLYAFMGIFTTAIFWGFEFSFEYIYQSKEMRYLGASIGLAIGYYIKYQLDKRFVFVTEKPRCHSQC